MKKRFYVYIIYVMFLFSCFFAGEFGDLRAQSRDIFEDQLKTAKENYAYANWEAETGKVIAGLDISKAILPQLEGMSNVWPKDNYRIQTYQETTYVKIRQWRASEDSQLDVIMVVCPTFSAAKKYLISHYAGTQMAPQVTKPAGSDVGLDIGNLCFATAINQGQVFLDVDFIRHNVLIMMRAQGDFREELAAAARTLDSLLLKKETKGDYSELKEIPFITQFSCEKAKIKLGERVLLELKVDNPTGGELRYFWKISGGGVKKNLSENFVYYGGEAGLHTIRVTVVNELGLYYSRSLEVEVVK